MWKWNRQQQSTEDTKRRLKRYLTDADDQNAIATVTGRPTALGQASDDIPSATR
jgi:hypothetical protein